LVPRQDTGVERYDRWAPSYDESALRPAFEAAHAAVLRMIVRLARRPGRILDIGCGTGLLLRRASRLFPGSDLVGVDVSGGMLATAGAAPGRMAFVQARAEHLPFPDEAFDLVLATMSIRHWADPAAGLWEIGRVLGPGGLFGLADVPSGMPPAGRRGWSRKLRGFASASLVPRSVVGSRTPGRSLCLASAGLTVVEVGRVHGYGPVHSVAVTVARRGPTR
jgi:ubiquinone/menaquinone biosynthesis C-methylase UbiE